MTQEEKLEQAKSLYKDANTDQRYVLEQLFPELAESRDERIRKEIIKIFNVENFEGYNVDNAEAIEWLEKQGQARKITHEEICKSYGISDIGDFSDGYHTFNGLYRQRMILFAVLVNTYKDRAWKSWKHEDESDCFGGGWFIVGIDTPDGTYTYHYEAKVWDRFDCKILDKAKHWDGHDESDVERLFSLLEKQGEQKDSFVDFKARDWYVSKVDGKIHNIYHPVDKVEPMFKIGDTIVEKDLDECDYGTIKDIKDGRYIFTDGYGMNINEQNGWQLVKTSTNIKQKPAWSEEDECTLGETIQHLEGFIRIDEARHHCGVDVQYYQRDIDWLKSLKDRVRPQDTWKPTKDQIDALFAAVYLKALRNTLEKDSVKQLEELYKQLKKLRGE